MEMRIDPPSRRLPRPRSASGLSTARCRRPSSPPPAPNLRIPSPPSRRGCWPWANEPSTARPNCALEAAYDYTSALIGREHARFRRRTRGHRRFLAKAPREVTSGRARCKRDSYRDSLILKILHDWSSPSPWSSASANWGWAELLRDEVSAEEGPSASIPVNPKAVGTEILGETAYATLADIPDAIDMVQIGRNSEAAASAITDEAIDHPSQGGVDAAPSWAQRRRRRARRLGRSPP